MVRLIFSSLGNTYAKSGLIGAPEDIFYLSIDEAFGLADSPRDMKPEIENRKAAYAVFEKLPAYTRLIFENSEFQDLHYVYQQSFSHTAIISRELKKPSIVGVPDLTDTIRTGDIIRMDGGSGRIEILRRKEK